MEIRLTGLTGLLDPSFDQLDMRCSYDSRRHWMGMQTGWDPTGIPAELGINTRLVDAQATLSPFGPLSSVTVMVLDPQLARICPDLGTKRLCQDTPGSQGLM